MKIALILERFDPRGGGLEHWTWQFARSLVARGHEVHVVAFEFDEQAESEGIVSHRLERPRSRLERAEAIAAHMAGVQFDVVHDMGIGWEADIIHPHGGSTKALWEHNLMRIPKWRQIRLWRERRYRELAEIERRQHVQSSAVIVAVSHMVQRHFESLHGLDRERIRVIPNGVDVLRFTPANRETFRAGTRRELGVDGEVVFLMLAHNLLLKNADSLIRAAAKMIAGGSPVHVVIAGGKKPEPFAKLARSLSVSDAISFRGLVDSTPYYAAADVFVHPTWYDPCSLVTLEASASGLPVITTRFNGASELMKDGREGFLFDDPANIDALALRMGELLDPALREKMGAAGRAMALEHTFEKQTTDFIHLYKEILASKI